MTKEERKMLICRMYDGKKIKRLGKVDFVTTAAKRPRAALMCSRPAIMRSITNFDDVMTGESIVYLSRADREGTMPKERTAVSKEASDEIANALMNPVTEIEETTPAEWKTQNNGLKLADMQGVPCLRRMICSSISVSSARSRMT